MKTKLPWILVALLTAALVIMSIGRSAPREPKPVASAAKSDRKVLYWVDPMHPWYRSDRPGTAPDCGMALVPVREGDAASSATAGEVAISPEQQRMIGVQTAVAAMRPLSRTIRTTARISADETRIAKVTTKFDGYIDKLFVDFTGRSVHRGEPLFTIYSPELFAAEQEYLLALRAETQMPTLVEAAKQRLRLWDITDRDLREIEQSGAAKRSITIVSPVSGIVINKTAVAGARAMAGDPLFEIADLSQVWAVADVYESELPFVTAGASVKLTLNSLPGRTFSGRVSFIAPTVDEATRTVKVRIQLDNRDAALKPEMFADALIEQPKHESLVVPDSAVIQSGTRSVVFVVQPDGNFVPREVATGTKSEGMFEIRSGLTAGEKVATQANFLIDSESRLRTAIGGGK